MSRDTHVPQSRIDTVLEALDHPTQRSDEYGYPLWADDSDYDENDYDDGQIGSMLIGSVTHLVRVPDGWIEYEEQEHSFEWNGQRGLVAVSGEFSGTLIVNGVDLTNPTWVLEEQDD